MTIKNKNQRETLETQFKNLMQKLWASLVPPFTVSEVQDEYLKSVPESFYQGLLLLREHGYGNATFKQPRFMLKVQVETPGNPVPVWFALTMPTQHSGMTNEKMPPMPKGMVSLSRSSHLYRAIAQYAAEHHTAKERANLASVKFEQMMRAAKTHSEIFYALPLLLQYARANTNHFDWRLPAGRRPRDFEADDFNPLDVQYVNETLLLAMLTKDQPINGITWNTAVQLLQNETGGHTAENDD